MIIPILPMIKLWPNYLKEKNLLKPKPKAEKSTEGWDNKPPLDIDLSLWYKYRYPKTAALRLLYTEFNRSAQGKAFVKPK